MYRYTHTYVYIHIHVHVHVHIHIDIYIYTYIYTYICQCTYQTRMMAFLKANQSLQYWGNDSVFSICLAAYGSFGLHCFHLFRFLLTLHSSFQKCLNRTGTQYLILREFEWPAAQTQSSALPKACWTASVHVSQPKIPWAESVHAIG